MTKTNVENFYEFDKTSYFLLLEKYGNEVIIEKEIILRRENKNGNPIL